MGPEALAQVLRPLTKYSLPTLLIGLQTGDDAAVYQLSPDQAIVQTVDFFPPVVDDPYTYGAIAAANSMSDVYAMGGEVLLALSVAAFPDNLPIGVIQAILQGGADKMAEGGGVIAGGHTVTDREPKYGLSVTGLVHPQRMLTKGNARPGDAAAPHQASGHRGHHHSPQGGQGGPGARPRCDGLYAETEPPGGSSAGAFRGPVLHRHHGLRSAGPRLGDGFGQRCGDEHLSGQDTILARRRPLRGRGLLAGGYVAQPLLPHPGARPAGCGTQGAP